jgi:hypothetical protein
MVKKVSVKQKQNVRQSVNVRVHIGDKKKKRNYRRKKNAGGSGSTEIQGSSYIPFSPVYIQSGNAPHLEIPTIRTPAIVEQPVPIVNRLEGASLQQNNIPRGETTPIVPVPKQTRRKKIEMDEARAMWLEDKNANTFSMTNPMLSPRLPTRIRNLAKENPTPRPTLGKQFSDSDSDGEKIVRIINDGEVSGGGVSRRTYKPRRSKEEIEAEKREKEARRLQRQLDKK